MVAYNLYIDETKFFEYKIKLKNFHEKIKAELEQQKAQKEIEFRKLKENGSLGSFDALKENVLILIMSVIKQLMSTMLEMNFWMIEIAIVKTFANSKIDFLLITYVILKFIFIYEAFEMLELCFS